MEEFLDFENNDNIACAAENEKDLYQEDQSKSSASKSNSCSQNRLNLSCFITEVDRFQISDRAAAALATGLMRDLGLVSDSDKSQVVDRYKVRRERKKRQKDKKRKRKEETAGNVNCLGFDGKKDKHTRILIESEVDGKIVLKQAIRTEEHIVFVDEPSGKYLIT